MARIRRKPEEARNTILDASENLLLEQGLAGLKLAKVAQVVGISHPGVLHHFGSADGLLEAVHQRISLKLRTDIITSLEDPEAKTVEERLSKL
ncbi:MAG: TetR/AcrR family transcriptional regulator, partial [Deltaproteobacteria bacterium]|nr:TetR/AcrR family transcriptional regulator [Deltaproteobacteria bacterium]